MKRNIYTHEIELSNLEIKNRPREEFRYMLESVKYRGYEVEKLVDGRKIVITKPGGKFVFGKIRREDLMVWVYNPIDSTLWLISHKDIYNDLEGKGNIDSVETIRIIDALERVFNGEEPDDVLDDLKLNNPIGELPEVLMKAYKWIWGQEDCNYPDGQGRDMSMNDIKALRDRLRRNVG
jgi:acyl carrier protein